MASFVVLTSFRTIQVLGPTLTQDAEYAVCSTVPHGFGFAYAVPIDSWAPPGAPPGSGPDPAAVQLLDVIATQLEALAANGEAVGSVPVQDVDRNGLITDAVDVTVAYDRSAQGLPTLYGTVTIPIQAFFNQETGIGGFHVGEPPNQYVVDEYHRLAALAAA